MRRWRSRRGHAAGGHVVHVGACLGCHVAVRLAYGGPTGIVGPWLGSGGGNANALPHPTILSHASLFFLACGTMSHTFLTYAARVAAQHTSDSIKTAEIAWTRVTRRDREVVDFTRYSVKNYSEFTNFGNL